MNQVLYIADDVKKMIENGERLLLAGDESVLKTLPKGHWIGGTIPYFMGEKGGLLTRDQIYVTKIPPYVKKIMLKTYSAQSIENIYAEAPENGLSIVIIPASSDVHFTFALKAPGFADFAARPLIGWISGVHVDDIGKVSARVFFGEQGTMHEDRAVAMHLSLPEGKYAEINIVNIFEQGGGDSISFPEDGFSVSDALVNGKQCNFSEYLEEKGLDTRLPLVANYSGAMINVSIQAVDMTNKRVNFYAPVFKGVEYRHAKPLQDYVAQFISQMPKEAADAIFFSCNCILNYLYSELEGKKTGGITGPITFGEIAYQLLNQTLAYAVIKDM